MTLHYNINNEEYRDMTRKSVYPFVDNASLNNGVIVIPYDLFLDLIVYVSGEYTAPFYISAIDGLQGDDDQALLTISDAVSQEVGTAYLDRTTDLCYIKQGTSVQAGVIVYDQDQMIRFLGELGRTRTVFSSLQTPLAAGQCFAIKPADITAVAGESRMWTGDVDIMADKGFHFETYVDGGGDDVLVINLYGESPIPPGGLLTINGIAFPEGHVWFAAHPDSNIRTLIDGNDIKIADKRDIGYGE